MHPLGLVSWRHFAAEENMRVNVLTLASWLEIAKLDFISLC